MNFIRSTLEKFSWQWIASHWKEENFTKIKSNINVKLDIESDSFLGLSTFNLCDKCPYQERNYDNSDMLSFKGLDDFLI